MHRAFAALAVIAVLVALWWTWGAIWGTPESTAGVEQVEPPAKQATPAPAVQSEQPSERHAVQPEPEGKRTPVVVRVLREDTRQPVAGARVSVFDWDRFWRECAKVKPAPDRAGRRAIAERISTFGSTDERGRVELSIAGSRVSVTAVRDELWGRKLVMERTSEPVDVLVSEDWTVRARVRRGSAFVPGVGVRLVRRRDGKRTQVVGSRLSHAPDGIATFEHAQSRIKRGQEAFLAFSIPLANPPRFAVPDRRTEPVDMWLPDTGSVEIRVRDENGRPLDPSKLEMRAEAFANESRSKAIDTGGSFTRPGPAGIGKARIAYVGLGLLLRIRVEDSGRTMRPVTVDARGPVASGETVVVDVTLDSRAEWPVLAGRFVRKGGKPWPAVELAVDTKLFPYSPCPSRKLELDAAGRFELVLRSACPKGGKRVLVFTAAGAVPAVCEVDVSRDLPPGVTDLGDLVLDHGAFLVSGQVVDSLGKPLARLMVNVCRFTRLDDREFWPTIECVGRRFTNEAGEFEVYAMPGQPIPAAKLKLSVYHRGVWHKQPFTAGARHVRMVLSNGGAIAGSVVLGPGQAPGDVSIVLLQGNRGSLVTVGEDGQFEERDLPAGSYKLIASLRGAPKGASRVQVEGIEVVDGQVTRDPRIQGLRLEESGAHVELLVVDEKSQPVRARVRMPGVDDFGVRTDSNGKVTIRPPRLPVDVEVLAFGFRRATVRGVTGDRRIRLERGLPVRFVTGAKPIGKDPDYHLSFFLYHADATGRRTGLVYGRDFPYQKRYFDERGVVELRLPGPGTYVVRPHVFVDKGNIGRGGDIDLKPLPRFTVVEQATVQEFRIEIPDRLVEAAVKKAAK